MPFWQGSHRRDRPSTSAAAASTKLCPAANEISTEVTTQLAGLEIADPDQLKTSGTQSRYSYRPLPTQTTIRLLELKPGQDGDELRARFRLADIGAAASDPPDYEALSYTWGENVFPERLHITDEDDGGVNGQSIPIPITRNLNCALRRFRPRRDGSWPQPPAPQPWAQLERWRLKREAEKAKEPDGNGSSQPGQLSAPTGPRLIWVDAVCINQTDLTEKSTQVALMNRVYGRAAKVLVWLGEAGPPSIFRDGAQFDGAVGAQSATDVAFDGFEETAGWVRESCADILQAGGARSLFALLDGRHLLQEAMRYRSVELNDHVRGNELDWIYTCDWFSRVWTVQEVALAREAVVCMRDRQMGWDTFVLALSLLGSAARGHDLELREGEAFERAIRVVEVTLLYRLSTSAGSTSYRPLDFFARIVQKMRSQNCTLDQDRIYALLNLQGEAPVVRVTPDYGRTVNSVFVDFARRLANGGNMELLYHAGAWQRDDIPRTEFVLRPDPLPSWVPDFRKPSGSDTLPWFRGVLSAQPAVQLPDTDGSDTGANIKLRVEALVIDGLADGAAARLPSPGVLMGGERSSYQATCDLVRKCKRLYLETRDLGSDSRGKAKSYPLGPSKEDDADGMAPLWCTLASFSEVLGTPPSTVADASWTCKGIFTLGALFDKHCLDPAGFITSGEWELMVDIGRERVLEAIDGDEEMREEVQLALMYYDLVRASLAGTSFFVTYKGIVGLSTPRVQLPGDVIAVIKGAQLPFVLRKLPIVDSYMLVGTCYVYGLMDVRVSGNHRAVSLY